MEFFREVEKVKKLEFKFLIKKFLRFFFVLYFLIDDEGEFIFSIVFLEFVIVVWVYFGKVGVVVVLLFVG